MKLTNEEKETLKSYENGEWSSTKKLAAARKQLQQYAKNALREDRRINIRISESDLVQLQRKAVQDGLPYQTLISSVLHRFINGRLKAKIRRGCAVVDGEAHPYRCDAPGMGGCSVQNIQRPSVLPKKQGWSPWRRVLTLRISRKQLRMSACSLVRE